LESYDGIICHDRGDSSHKHLASNVKVTVNGNESEEDSVMNLRGIRLKEAGNGILLILGGIRKLHHGDEKRIDSTDSNHVALSALTIHNSS